MASPILILLFFSVTARRTTEGVVLFITQPEGRAFPSSASVTPVDTPLHTPTLSRRPSFEKLDRGAKSGYQMYSMGLTPGSSTIQ